MFLFQWLLQLKSALVEFALEPFHPKSFLGHTKGLSVRVDIVFLLILVFGGCVSLLFYHLFFYRYRYRWVISVIIISLTIKNYGWYGEIRMFIVMQQKGWLRNMLITFQQPASDQNTRHQMGRQ